MVSPAPPLARAWRPVALRLLVVAGAIALGLALQQVVTARLAAIQELSQTDVIAARRELAFVFRVAAVALVGGIGGLGVAIAHSCRRARAEGRFPPSGTLAFGRARNVVTGPESVAKLYVGLWKHGSVPTRVLERTINGIPALDVELPTHDPRNAARSLMWLELDEHDAIRAINIVLAPAKLAAVPWPATDAA